MDAARIATGEDVRGDVLEPGLEKDFHDEMVVPTLVMGKIKPACEEDESAWPWMTPTDSGVLRGAGPRQQQKAEAATLLQAAWRGKQCRVDTLKATSKATKEEDEKARLQQERSDAEARRSQERRMAEARSAKEGADNVARLKKEQDQKKVDDFLRANGFSSACAPRRKLFKTTFPLHLAAEKGDVEMTDLLLQAGARRAQRDSGSKTAKQIAEAKDVNGSHSAVVRRLAATGPAGGV